MCADFKIGGSIGVKSTWCIFFRCVRMHQINFNLYTILFIKKNQLKESLQRSDNLKVNALNLNVVYKQNIFGRSGINFNCTEILYYK